MTEVGAARLMMDRGVASTGRVPSVDEIAARLSPVRVG